MPQNNQTEDAISSVLKAAIGLKADSKWVEENIARYYNLSHKCTYMCTYIYCSMYAHILVPSYSDAAS
jgi:hypothetical protein